MVVRLNANDSITCSIGGIDLTNELTGFSANYSSLSLPSSGLIQMTGSLSLTQGQLSPDFDTRFVNTWRRGTRIELTMNGRFLPVCGVSYIITADYDMASSLSIKFGCALSLYNFVTTSDLGICAEYGEELPLFLIIRDMIIAAGVDPALTVLSDFGREPLLSAKLVQPLLVGASQSLLQAAGKLTAQYGGFIYQDGTGLIRVAYLNDDLQYLISRSADELQTYARVGLPESVVKKVTYNYNTEILCSALGTSAKSISSGDTLVEVVEFRDEDLRTSSSTIIEKRDVGGDFVTVSTTTQESTYEAPPISALTVNRNGSVQSLSTCFPNDQARILSKTITSTSDNTEILKAWISAKSTAAVPSGFSLSGTITSELTEEDYVYENTTITKTTNVFLPKGVAIPLTGDLTLGRGTGPVIADESPEILTPYQRIIETWSKPQEPCLGWSYTSTTFQNRSTIRPEDIDLRVDDGAVDVQTIVDEGLELVPIARDQQFNRGEPRFETFQTVAEIALVPGQIVVGSEFGTGGDFEVVDEISLGDYFVFDEQSITEYCSRLMDFRNGRILGMQIAFPVEYLEETDWAFFVPSYTIKIGEPSHLRRGVASVFWIDSPSIVCGPEEIILSCVGSFKGFSNEVNNSNAFTDTLIKPLTLPSSDPSASAVSLDVNYNITMDFNFTYNG